MTAADMPSERDLDAALLAVARTEPTSGPRYAVFAGPSYYPTGGWNDLVCLTHNLREAERALMGKSCDWWQIIDLYTGTIIDSSEVTA